MIIHLKVVYTRCQGAHERNIYIKKDAQNHFYGRREAAVKACKTEKDLEKRDKGNRTASMRRGISKRKLS